MGIQRRRGFSIQNNKPDNSYEVDNDLDYNIAQIKRKKSVYDTDYKQPYFICFLYYITFPFAYVYNKIHCKIKKTTHE